jgi:flavodoxin
MKKLIVLLASLTMIFSSMSIYAQSTSAAKKILVVYFSHSGNTREIANQIKNATKGDIFELQPVKPYPEEYQTVVDQAKQEIRSNYKPELKNKVENIDSYDVICIGSPNWWSTIAPPVATFLSGYNLSGKTIVPFITHGGGGLGHSVKDIKALCPNSTVLDALAVSGSDVKEAQKDVLEWLRKLKIIE